MPEDDPDIEINSENLEFQNGSIVDQDVNNPVESPDIETPGERENPHRTGQEDLEEFKDEIEREAAESGERHSEPRNQNIVVHGLNYNSEDGELATVEMIDETIQDRPYLVLYAASIVLMMVSFNLPSPLFALLGAGLMLMTTLHYVD